MSLEHLHHLILDIVHVGLAILVCADDVECIDEQGLDPTFLKIVGYHVGAYNLALSQDDLLLETCEVNLREGTQIIELIMQEPHRLLLDFVRTIELINMPSISLLKLIYDSVRTFGILLVEVIGDFDEGVCRARHSREDNELGLPVFCNEF